ncbi:MAG: L-glyceraldehyde 3-phosphate reductase [Candidatus Marinimicrobia bacterium]|jgi:L-glyceraldehyde 3-phosphate reductase|nr:L-glyceraldehyde 3-phosphate reductase [Candidatus Neomarinimicrobiota bacterium]MBT3575649.1 L-glyceraldehyde 3-phosphate reductase [Candidatus Neomarinimicrobiota bacterium]MBT3679868.1 L-glyceraldehyde 3-phosphate reductase [Candidatus Neomarinimicrobiota bacterium]MBT3952046.1 L-glyceraldehyde 3-phosphate reductase [Candidatus Neomarinimicrobiota bacterium]MBT4251937.1 L-glyceraldehyde 3-phosphate reductase [Candidatus Neomarinimicrobiota bacterium]
MYHAAETRYDNMSYQRCGVSGIKLPRISLGLWHNFGEPDDYATAQSMLRRAFDLGITHFDLANNYGPPYGAAETTFGKLFKEDFRSYRDELLISTKAGWDMWPGPYGDHGSRKYLIASIDQSLQRMGLDYVDIFYHHRPDTSTPLEESMGALDQIVRSGKALYVGISSYNPEQTRQASKILRELGTPCLIHQPKYNMFHRQPENGLFDELKKNGVGSIVFSPLAQGVLTDRYLDGFPEDSRAVRDGRYLKPEFIKDAQLEKVRALKKIANARGQNVAQLAIAWVLRKDEVTSALIGASKVSQIEDAVSALGNLNFDATEQSEIENILG